MRNSRSQELSVARAELTTIVRTRLRRMAATATAAVAVAQTPTGDDDATRRVPA